MNKNLLLFLAAGAALFWAARRHAQRAADFAEPHARGFRPPTDDERARMEELNNVAPRVRILEEGEMYTQDFVSDRKNIRPDGTLIGYF